MNPKSRMLIVLLALLLPVLNVRAQDTFTCLDNVQYTPQIQLTLPVNENHPALEADLPNPYFVAVMGLNNVLPVVSIQSEGIQQGCSQADPLAGAVAASLPTAGEILPSLSSAMVIAYTLSDYQVDIAEKNGTPGEFLVFIDGGSSVPQDRDGDVYDIAITPELAASGIPLTAYLFSADSEYDPSLSLVDENGRVVRDENNQTIACEDAGNADTCYGESVSLEDATIIGYTGEPLAGTPQSAMLTLPLPEALAGTTLRLRVDTAQRPGAYALVLHLGHGKVNTTGVVAALTENENHTLALSCNGETVFENGVKILLPPRTNSSAETPYRVTLAAGTTVPVLGVFNDAGEGSCYEQTPAAFSYAAQLPDVSVSPSSNSAQAVLSPDATMLVIGNRDSLPDFITVFIEGYSAELADIPQETDATTGQVIPVLPETISGESFGVWVSPGMADSGEFLTAFTISAVDELDVWMAQVDENGTIVTGTEGQPAACDNAGLPLLCQEGTTVLNGYQVTLADGRILPAFGLDAMLRIPILPENAGQTLNFVTSSLSQVSRGDYVLVLHVKLD